MASNFRTGALFTPGWSSCSVAACNSESRGSKSGKSDSTLGTEGVAIGAAVSNNLAKVALQESASWEAEND